MISAELRRASGSAPSAISPSAGGAMPTMLWITVFGMVWSIGIVVDDAIVVLENIFRHVEEGLAPFQAALKGAKEIGFAAQRGNALTQQLLAFARRQVMELQPLDLNSVVREMEPILRRLIRADVALHVDLAGDLGEHAVGVLVAEQPVEAVEVIDVDDDDRERKGGHAATGRGNAARAGAPLRARAGDVRRA